VAFVDGSVNQGAAGVGVWYGAGHRLNFAAAAGPGPHTNQFHPMHVNGYTGAP